MEKISFCKGKDSILCFLYTALCEEFITTCLLVAIIEKLTYDQAIKNLPISDLIPRNKDWFPGKRLESGNFWWRWLKGSPVIRFKILC